MIQGNAGIVAGNITADEARLAGTVEDGDGAHLVVEATARIMGDVAYDVISIEAGAQIDGRLARRTALGFDAEDRSGLIATPVSSRPPPGRMRTPIAIMFALPGSATTQQAAE
jgi:hypothetical protein